MKLFTFLLFFFISSTLCGQTCDEMIRRTKESMKKKDYFDAYLKCEAARRPCPERAAEIDSLKLKSIYELKRLRETAEKAQKQAESEKKTALKEKERADSALNIATTIVDAMYFYDDKFALAYDGGYGFINKSGKKVIEYKYDYALPFDDRGFAKVKKSSYDEEYYLIDTTGTEYLLAEDIKELTYKTRALDLSNKTANFKDTLYTKIFKYTNLEILLLNNCRIDTLSESIGNLTKLTTLNLYGNQLTTLPETIGNLTKLTTLNLGNNPILSSPISLKEFLKNKIKKDIWQRIYEPHSIHSLNFSSMKLLSLPKEIGNLSNLEELSLRNNLLSVLPKEIGNLSNLKSLDLEANYLTSLPKEIGNLSNLEELFLSGEKKSIIFGSIIMDNPFLSSLPNEIMNLKKINISLNWNPVFLATDSLKYFLKNQLSCNTWNKFYVSDSAVWEIKDIESCIRTKKIALVLKIREAMMKQPEFKNIAKYGELSWLCIFSNDFEGAIWAGEKYVEKGGKDIGSLSHLAIGYLYNGNYEKALDIYKEYKNETTPENEIGKDIFLDDLKKVAKGSIKTYLSVGTECVKPKNQEDVDKIRKFLEE